MCGPKEEFIPNWCDAKNLLSLKKEQEEKINKLAKEKHLSDVEIVNQHRKGK